MYFLFIYYKLSNRQIISQIYHASSITKFWMFLKMKRLLINQEHSTYNNPLLRWKILKSIILKLKKDTKMSYSYEASLDVQWVSKPLTSLQSTCQIVIVSIRRREATDWRTFVCSTCWPLNDVCSTTRKQENYSCSYHENFLKL